MQFLIFGTYGNIKSGSYPVMAHLVLHLNGRSYSSLIPLSIGGLLAGKVVSSIFLHRQDLGGNYSFRNGIYSEDKKAKKA